MDSVEVAVRITEAVMAKSTVARNIKPEDLAESYIEMFTAVFKRVNVVLNPDPVLPPRPRATSDIFPLSRD